MTQISPICPRCGGKVYLDFDPVEKWPEGTCIMCGHAQYGDNGVKEAPEIIVHREKYTHHGKRLNRDHPERRQRDLTLVAMAMYEPALLYDQLTALWNSTHPEWALGEKQIGKLLNSHGLHRRRGRKKMTEDKAKQIALRIFRECVTGEHLDFDVAKARAILMNPDSKEVTDGH
ncbi:MAG: hypothetical protein KKD77_22795 [Gammaproteobacteria bacterium]|nr:hypothetical protein [Gammaproteobacteria bacterium]